MSNKSRSLFIKRKRRVRLALKKKVKRNHKLRLTVFRSNRHIYAQLIDDFNSCTIVSASTLERQFNMKGEYTGSVKAAIVVGKMIAERARKLNISSVVFDRGGYAYHGKVKALANAARDNGLLF